ncbi:hypothetical protein E0485_22675 [Paenibacillus albiflavus]|uniref:Uncharacterized protein n=1 Tax=Paenibacillus albiflavus TaxID=2545760 RepID=A0A4R4DZ95_9BACL|nr:hypothetical protein [Paenibacillus albiflavus]TCZ71459.1 hypothetical protein E0485_22675 [Paenibacillus albiflavus]
MNLVIKRVGQDRWEDINHQFSKYKLSFLDEVLEYGKDNDIPESTLIYSYKEFLSEHIQGIELDLEVLKDIAEKLIPVIELNKSDELIIGDKTLKIINYEPNLELMYYSGYDKFLKLNRYGFISLSPSKKGYKLNNCEVLFSKYEQLHQFDLKAHFDVLLCKLESANSIESIELGKAAIEHELRVIFGVGHYSELMDDHVKLNIDKMEFIRSISLCFRRCEAKILLLEKGESKITDSLIKLILAKKNYDNFIENKDEYVELLGNDKYNEKIARDSGEISDLLIDVGLSAEDLEHLVH